MNTDARARAHTHTPASERTKGRGKIAVAWCQSQGCPGNSSAKLVSLSFSLQKLPHPPLLPDLAAALRVSKTLPPKVGCVFYCYYCRGIKGGTFTIIECHVSTASSQMVDPPPTIWEFSIARP